MFRQGVIFKNDKFFTWQWISRSRLNQFTPKTDMTLSCSNNCLRTRSNQKNVPSHYLLWNPCPFLMESNLELSKIPRLHWMIQDASQELIPQRSIGLRSELTKITRFVLASAHTRWLCQRETYRLLGEVNWLRLEFESKPIVWNLSF